MLPRVLICLHLIAKQLHFNTGKNYLSIYAKESCINSLDGQSPSTNSFGETVAPVLNRMLMSSYKFLKD